MEEDEDEQAPRATSQAIVSTAWRAYEKDSEERTMLRITAREYIKSKVPLEAAFCPLATRGKHL